MLLNPIDRSALSIFEEKVAMKYQLFNGLFLTLPFEDLDQVGMELPVFSKYVREKIEAGQNPKHVIEKYFKDQRRTTDFTEIARVLFKFLQFVERQVVLFDALEDAAFEEIQDLKGEGTLTHLLSQVKNNGKEEEFLKLIQDYSVRIVLTAHPTQFYPGSVLGIITDLAESIKENNLTETNDLLLQMGKTRFKNKEKPTPGQEAKSLIWYLQNIFYEVVPTIMSVTSLSMANKEKLLLDHALIELGFWPGGDRDGNPFVTHETTLEVARNLKTAVLSLYRKDLSGLKKRLTFEGVLDKLSDITLKVQATYQASITGKKPGKNGYQEDAQLLADLKNVRLKLVENHRGLFVDKLDNLIYKVISFGFHFASLDMRQDSRILTKVMLEGFKRFPELTEKLTEDQQSAIKRFDHLDDQKKYELLTELIDRDYPTLKLEKEEKQDIVEETLLSIMAVRTIQSTSGEKGLHRYIISNTQRASDLLTVILLAKWVGWKGIQLKLDITPLFETVEDLQNAQGIMGSLYQHKTYKSHLTKRGQVQHIMLGFSDGTKDGGTVAANWGIHLAKERLTSISRQAGMTVHFFDGRGGPPSRGGGNTHKYYRAQGEAIEQKQIQLTIQGQTISSKFGTHSSGRFNLENLLTASLEESLFPTSHSSKQQTDYSEHEVMNELSKEALDAYLKFKGNELFVPYLEELTPLRFFSQLTIASRPTKRKSSNKLNFEDLRAIPFVSSWSQMKQNIPGYYGLGYAIESMEKKGELEKVKWLYRHSLFFRTLVENAMQSLTKSNMKLTTYIKSDKKFGKFWKLIDEEFTRTKEKLLLITNQSKLLATVPHIRASIKVREKVVFPLLVVQQYALMRLNEEGESLDKTEKQMLEKMVIKSLAANVNASRNSA